MKQIRKLLALFLALAMCMSMLSVSVWAANTPESIASKAERMEALVDEAKKTGSGSEAADPEAVKEIEEELDKMVSDANRIAQKERNSAELATQEAVSIDPVHVKATYNVIYNWLINREPHSYYFELEDNSKRYRDIGLYINKQTNDIGIIYNHAEWDKPAVFKTEFSFNQNGIVDNQFNWRATTPSYEVTCHASFDPETLYPNTDTIYNCVYDSDNSSLSRSTMTKLASNMFSLLLLELSQYRFADSFTIGDMGFIALDPSKHGSIHNWNSGTVTKQATCGENGVRTYTCSFCGQTKTESIPATGNHKWDDGTITTEPTCAETGIRTYTCMECRQTKTEVIPATGNHKWDDGIITTEPTYTEDGVMTYTCTGCGKTKTESIPAKEKESNEVYTDDIVLSYSDKKQTVNLNASNFYETEMTYESDTDEVSVNDEGIATIDAGFSGVAVITVTSVETEEYAEAEETLKITVPTVTNVKKATVKKKQLTVEWKKNTTGKGYEVQCSTDKNFKKSVKKVKIGKNKTTKTTIKKLKKGTYYVRIRTVNGKKTSAWSKTKSVKVK